MPSGAKKQLTMYIPLAAADLFNRNVRIELRGTQGDGGQKLLGVADAEIKILLNQVLVGVLAPNPDNFQLYDNIVIGQPQPQNPTTGAKGGPVIHLALAQLEASRLPSMGQAWGSLNGLLVQDFDLASLSTEQQAALETWVRNGGTLIVSGGPSASRSLKGLPEGLRPAEVPGPNDFGPLEASQISALQKLAGGLTLPPNTAGSSYIFRLKPTPDTTINLKAGNDPLLLELRRGSGSVVLTAFDLSEKRFSNWDGSSLLWEALVGRNPQAAYGSGNIYSSYGLNFNFLSGNLSSLLTNIPGIDIPPLRLIALLALIYVILVGPVNYFVLKRLNRRELSWVTLPALTIIFTLGVYMLALRDKGSEVITSSVNIVRLDARDASSGPLQKSVLGLVGVFVPNDNNYRLELPPNSLTSAIPSYIPNYGQVVAIAGGPGGQPQLPPTSTPLPAYQPPVGLRVVQGDRAQVDLLGMSQWSFRSVVVEGSTRLEGSLSGELAQNDGRVKGSITNRTGLPLKDVTVLANFGYLKLGELQPGQTASVDFANVFGQPNSLFNNYQKGAYYSSGPYGPAPVASSSPGDRTEARKRELLNLMYGYLPGGYQPAYYGSDPRSNPTSVAVVGWSEKPLLGYTVNGRQIGGNDLTLLVAELSINRDRSNELLPGEMRGKVVEKQEVAATAAPAAGSSSGSPPRPAVPPNGVSLEIGQVTVEFDLPRLAQNPPARLVLESPGYLYRKNGFGPQLAPRYAVELYNFKKGSWEPVPVMLAPVSCLPDITPYKGGGVPTSILGFGQGGPKTSPACASAIQGAPFGGPPPTPTPALPPTNPPANGTPTPSSIRALPTATPQGTPTRPANGYRDGPADGFVVLEEGPDFNLADFISPDGKLRARYSRDPSLADVMFWSYFSVGYRLK